MGATAPYLVHFSGRSLVALRSVRQSDSMRIKPKGLWVSVEGDDDGWSNWCEQEKFNLGPLTHAHEIVLAKDTTVLWLRNAPDIDAFTERYQCTPAALKNTGICFDGHYIDWKAVAAQHQGIIIAPYCWSRRLHEGCSWYYGWDCASGCIWDVNAIASWQFIEREAA